MRELPPLETLAVDDSPPLAKLPWIPVTRAPARGVQTVILLSGLVRGIWIHSVDKRDTPCAGDHCKVLWNGRHQARRRKRFIAACFSDSRKRTTLELSEDAWRDYWEHRQQRVAPDRGVYATVTRIGNAVNSPARVTFEPPGELRGQLPEAFDVIAAMYRLWLGESHIEEAPAEDEPAA